MCGSRGALGPPRTHLPALSELHWSGERWEQGPEHTHHHRCELNGSFSEQIRPPGDGMGNGGSSGPRGTTWGASDLAQATTAVTPGAPFCTDFPNEPTGARLSSLGHRREGEDNIHVSGPKPRTLGPLRRQLVGSSGGFGWRPRSPLSGLWGSASCLRQVRVDMQGCAWGDRLVPRHFLCRRQLSEREPVA